MEHVLYVISKPNFAPHTNNDYRKWGSTNILLREIGFFPKNSSMSVQISNNKAYQDYLDLKLGKQASKCATIENVTAILKHNNVEVNQKPSQPVSFFLVFIETFG